MYHQKVSVLDPILKYLITPFHIVCKEGQFDAVILMVNNQFKAFGIKLNILQVNGMTQFNMPSLLSVFEGTIF